MKRRAFLWAIPGLAALKWWKPKRPLRLVEIDLQNRSLRYDR